MSDLRHGGRMTPLRTLLVTTVLTCLAASTALGENVTQLLTDAQAAYLRGDLESAKRDFELINRVDPRNKVAIGYLRMIKTQMAKGGGGSAQEKQLQALILPKVQLQDATLGSVLEFLKNQATKNSDGKANVNFVVQLPEEMVKTKAVTLSLTNVPFTEVLRYLGDLAEITFTYEKYAISVKPKGAATTAAATTKPGS